MTDTQLYEDLAKHLEQGIVGTPKSSALIEILKIIFPVEEAKIALKLPMQNQTLSESKDVGNENFTNIGGNRYDGTSI